MKAFVSNRVVGALSVALLGLCCAMSFAANLDATAEQQIRAATFEVVQLKSPDGAVAYERPLPMELIPYQQRVDKYPLHRHGIRHWPQPLRHCRACSERGLGQPVWAAGTARHRGHGLRDRQDSQIFRRPGFLCEFSLKKVPSPERVLPTAAPPPLNDAVFAAGNALGEGVVIRDGVYTSQTPEESSGPLAVAAVHGRGVAR